MYLQVISNFTNDFINLYFIGHILFLKDNNKEIFLILSYVQLKMLKFSDFSLKKIVFYK